MHFLLIYPSPAPEDRGLKVFEPLVGGGTYREVFKFCWLLMFVWRHMLKGDSSWVDVTCGDMFREILVMGC